MKTGFQKKTECKHMVLMAMVLFAVISRAFSQGSTSDEEPLPKEKILGLYIKINAPLDSVWSRLSSQQGMQKFFAPVCILDPKPLGKLEIHFAPTAPAGQRGAENNLVLAVQEKKMISFTWDAPPQWPEIRKHRTAVAIRLHAVSAAETLVTLSQTGWGTGSDWDAVYTYFGNAWGGFVLPNLKYSLEVKPVNWTDFPKNAPQGLKPAGKLQL